MDLGSGPVVGHKAGEAEPASRQPATRYEIHLSVFQGPLDLLLHLIEKRTLDITVVSLVEVTSQYFEHLQRAENVDLEALSDFITIGAKLLLIKSLSLLPRRTIAAETEVEEDPGEELAQLLQEYRRYKLIAGHLQKLEATGLRSYPRLAPVHFEPTVRLEPMDLSLLLKALSKMVANRRPELSEVVALDPVTVAEKIAELESALTRQPRLSFNELIARCETRMAIAASFLALLHLLRNGKVVALQESLFGEIVILPAPASN